MTFRLVVQLVRNIGKESAQAGEEGFWITFPQLLYKLAYVEVTLLAVDRRIEGQYEVEKAVAYLFIRETEGICLKLFIITLNSEIPALINHRDGLFAVCPVANQCCRGHFDTIEFAQVIVSLLQHIYQEGGSAAGEPVVSETLLGEGA